MLCKSTDEATKIYIHIHIVWFLRLPHTTRLAVVRLCVSQPVIREDTAHYTSTPRLAYAHFFFLFFLVIANARSRSTTNREDSTCKKSSRLDSRVSRTTENLRAIVTIPVAESCEASRVVCRGLMRSCGLQRAAVYSARLMHTQPMCICLVFPMARIHKGGFNAWLNFIRGSNIVHGPEEKKRKCGMSAIQCVHKHRCNSGRAQGQGQLISGLLKVHGLNSNPGLT